MIFLLVISIILNGVLLYGAWNLLQQVETLEESVKYFYARLKITLHVIRELDERHIFEEDDEVGQTFSQIVEIMNELRPLLTGRDDTNES
jgi:hypothetical protein